MAVIPKVRRNAQVPTNGVGNFAPAQFSGQAAFTAASNIAGDIAGDALSREDARARQKVDLDFMRAATAYETGLSQIQMPQGGDGYTELAQAAFDGAFGELGANIPSHMRDEFAGRVESLKINLGQQAARAAESEAEAFSLFGLNQGLEMINGEAARNPDAAQGLIARGTALINANPDLSPAQRRTAIDQLTDGLTETAETRRVETDPIARQAYSGAADGASLIREFEGFETGTYWDVNAHRTGYGSDTITRADGSVVRVQEGMTVTKADAERDLQRRVVEFRNQAIRDVGDEAWAALPQNARAALESITYNYGNVPTRIRAAARSGDMEALAQAVEGLGGDNEGINRSRRNREAEVIRGGRVGLSAGTYGRVQNAAQQVMRREQDAIDAQNDITSAQLGVGVTTGQVTQDELDQALGDTVITPSRWESLTEQLFKEQERQRTESATRSSFLDRLEAGETGNPYDKDDRKAVNSMDEALERTLADNDQLELLPQARLQQLGQTGVATEGHIADLRQGILTGSADTFREIDQALQISPRSFDGVPGGKEVVEAAADFTAATRAGMTAENAARFADPNSEDRQRADKTEINKEIAELDTDDVIAKFDSWFPGDALSATPMMEQAIMRDYRVQYEAARLRGLDPATAQERAILKLTEPHSGVYGRSEVATGNLGAGLFSDEVTTSFDAGVVRHPPENFYPPINGSHEYLTNDIQESLKGVDGFDGEWFLMPDPIETDRAIKRQERGDSIYPGYRVYYTDKDTGALEYVFWGMDPATIEEAAAKDQAARKGQFDRMQTFLSEQRNAESQGTPLRETINTNASNSTGGFPTEVNQ